MTLIEFIEMGGHGKFVWSAYGVTAVVLVVNFALALRRLRKRQKDTAAALLMKMKDE